MSYKQFKKLNNRDQVADLLALAVIRYRKRRQSKEEGHETPTERLEEGSST